MGSLRTILSISVIFTHSYGHSFLSAKNAVQLFFIISGFLISYVLVELKNYSNVKDFYINRFLRLYPIYYTLILLIFVISYFLFDLTNLFSIWQQSPILAKVFLVISNAFVFGQDWVFFLKIEDDNLIFSKDFSTSEIKLYQGLIILPAWSLAIEISFYLIAPFILFNKRIIFILLVASIVLRAFLIKIGLGLHDPWTYRFFPTELSFFLIGSLTHQILYPFYKRILKNHIDLLSKLSTFFLIFFIVTFFKIPISDNVKDILLFTCFIILLPLIFLFNKKNKWDRNIGELSYPMYICHWPIYITVDLVSKKFIFYNEKLILLSCVFFSIFLAIILNVLVSKKINSIRNKFRHS